MPVFIIYMTHVWWYLVVSGACVVVSGACLVVSMYIGWYDLSWCCSCADSTDVLMLLNQDQDQLTDLFVAFCSSYISFKYSVWYIYVLGISVWHLELAVLKSGILCKESIDRTPPSIHYLPVCLPLCSPFTQCLDSGSIALSTSFTLHSNM